ncbi:MAG TPA: hypothetical protein VFD32_06610, partial [Dehalococcoidia bacterium]|nr:hypothetical protein [Dehalococcoidia bacterium]
MTDATLMGEAPAAAAPAAPAPAAAPAAQPAAAPAAAPQFVAADAVKFLTEHGVEAKSLEGVAEADLKSRYESAKAIADKAHARGKAEGAPKAPEKYELAAPKGVELDAEFAKEYEAAAREAGLPQDKAQKIFELGAKAVAKFGEKLNG